MPDLAAWGIDPGYHDTSGRWRPASPESLAAVLATMGATDAVAGPPPGPVQTVRLDHPLPEVERGTLHLEGGGSLGIGGPLDPELPWGYHLLQPDDGPERTLVVSPGRCPRPDGRRWGLSAQLYAARSRRSWGIGDLGDLARLGAWAGRLGARAVLLNPLHAGPPGAHPQPSPYFPSSRCFLNPLYLDVGAMPGAGRLPDLARLADLGRGLNEERLIDRERVWALKSAALEALFAAPGADAGLEEYLTRRGLPLQRFATFNALAEHHGLPWQAWPGSLRSPDSDAVAAFAGSNEGRARVRFHAWLQMHLERQLAAVAPTELIADLAVGADAGGADAWIWQQSLASGQRIGAPPDEFNRAGQDWGLPPWDPWRLRAAGYRPFIDMVRSTLRAAGGMRVDHVMGLFRLYWIPEGADATDGVYVRYPYWDLLNILALEASRAGAYVVGEDLGTVEDEVRRELAERDVLSYRLLWFEPDRPATWPERALGAVSTHDLPTVAGVWSGADLAAQELLGIETNEAGMGLMRQRLRDWAGAADGATSADAVVGAYRCLAGAPCDVLTVALDDLAAVEDRPNMPGTVGEWPNWSLALPVPLEELECSPIAAEVAGALSARPGDVGPASSARPGDVGPASSARPGDVGPASSARPGDVGPASSARPGDVGPAASARPGEGASRPAVAGAPRGEPGSEPPAPG